MHGTCPQCLWLGLFSPYNMADQLAINSRGLNHAFTAASSFFFFFFCMEDSICTLKPVYREASELSQGYSTTCLRIFLSHSLVKNKRKDFKLGAEVICPDNLPFIQIASLDKALLLFHVIRQAPLQLAFFFTSASAVAVAKTSVLASPSPSATTAAFFFFFLTGCSGSAAPFAISSTRAAFLLTFC